MIGEFCRDREFSVTTDLDRRSSRLKSYMLRHTVFATGVGLCRKAHCRDKEFHVATELGHMRRFPCRDMIFEVVTEFGS